MARQRRPGTSLNTFRPKQRKVPEGVYDMNCHDISTDGRGIASIAGKTVFVAGALKDEAVKARYIRSRKDFDEAEVVSVTDPSQFRVEPNCQYFNHCGGCSLQHLDYEQQIELKQRHLAHKVNGLGLDPSPHIAEPIVSSAYQYRHRVRLSVSADKKQCRVGFRRGASHQIIAIDECKLISATLNQLIPPLAKTLSHLSSRKLIEGIELIEDTYGYKAALIFTTGPLPADDRSALAHLAESQQLLLQLNYRKSGQTIIETVFSAGDKTLLEYVLPDSTISLKFKPGDFTQVNPSINAKMIETALQWLALNDQDRVLDLFCGIGNFSLPIAKHVAIVEGVEFDKSMVDKARANAQDNGIENIEFRAANLMKPDFKPAISANKALLDPPRAGALEVCKQLAAWGVEEIVYISCNPATFFRDAQELIASGYRMQKTGLLDMFPQTGHTELISYFNKLV